MKKLLAITSIALLAFYCAAVAVLVLSPLNPFGGGKWPSRGCDYMLRMSEVECLRKGVNPFDVWNGDVVMKPYVPFGGAHAGDVGVKEGFTDFINAYPPWEYVAMMPLSFLPKTFAWVLYVVGMMAGLWLLVWAGKALSVSYSKGDDESCAIVGAASVVFVSLPVFQNFQTGNFAVPVLVASVLMAICLNRGKDVLAGVCWAFAMLKPQIGLAFAVPLLILGKFKTCFVAAAICSALSVVPALMCHASPIDMIFQGARASSDYFMGCGTFPSVLRRFLPGDSGIYVGLIVGAVVCAVMTRMLRSSGVRNHIVLLMPAAVTSAAWTYAQCFNYSMNWFFFVVLFASMAKYPKSRFLWVLAALSAVFMTRLYNFAHFLPKAMPAVFPEFLPSESWHWHLDSLVSSISMLLTLVFCMWVAKHHVKCVNGYAEASS